MNPAVQSALISSLALIGVALITYRQTRKGSKATDALAQRVVDREDFESVMTRMEADLQRSDKRITELESRLEAEVAARKEADNRAAAAEKRASAAERRVTQLTKRVKQLEDELEVAKAALAVAVHDDDA